MCHFSPFFKYFLNVSNHKVASMLYIYIYISATPNGEVGGRMGLQVCLCESTSFSFGWMTPWLQRALIAGQRKRRRSFDESPTPASYVLFVALLWGWGPTHVLFGVPRVLLFVLRRVPWLPSTSTEKNHIQILWEETLILMRIWTI